MATSTAAMRQLKSLATTLLNPSKSTATTAALCRSTGVGGARCYAKSAAAAATKKEKEKVLKEAAAEEGAYQHEDEEEGDDGLTSGISRPLCDILKDLNEKVPDSHIKVLRTQDGFSTKYVPWHIINRMMNFHAPEWSGEVRSITYSADGNTVSVVYRVTVYGIDAEIYRESIGTAAIKDTSFGDPVQKAEAMAFRRACARLGLGLHLYHEEL